MYAIDSVKHRPLGQEEGLSRVQRELLIDAQTKSLEWADAKIGELVCKVRNTVRPLVLIVTSDHGEELGEGGRYGHGHPHETVLNVPFWAAII